MGFLTRRSVFRAAPDLLPNWGNPEFTKSQYWESAESTGFFRKVSAFNRAKEQGWSWQSQRRIAWDPKPRVLVPTGHPSAQSNALQEVLRWVRDVRSSARMQAVPNPPKQVGGFWLVWSRAELGCAGYHCASRMTLYRRPNAG